MSPLNRLVPPALVAGDRIGVIAPASAVDVERLERGLARLREWGFEPVEGKHLRARNGDLAGSDRERGADLRWATEADELKAVWIARGGWGAPRLLEQFELRAARRRPRWWIGFSDLTLLQARLVERGVATLYAPVVSELGDRGRVPDDSIARFLLEPGPLRFELEPQIRIPGRARGPLAGGCLSLLAAAAGTPHAARLAGSIVLLEDVGEPPYKIDRMLWQLRRSGAFDRVAGLLLSQFTRCEPAEGKASRPLAEVLSEHVRAIGVPTLSDFPAGHGDGARAVPLGYDCNLDATRKTVRLLPPG